MANGKWHMSNVKWRRFALSICLLPFAICHLPCRSDAISDNAGTKNGDFLKIPTDARGVALGDSVVSMAQGVDALRWNPAGLGTLEGKEAAATHVQYYQGVFMDNVGTAVPLEQGGLAANIFYLSAGTLDGRNTLGQPTGNFPYYDVVGTVGYGHKVLSRAEGADVSVGAALKMVQEKIANESFQNPAVDVGVLVTPLDKLNVAFTVRDLSSNSANFTREMIGGASYTIFNSFTGAFAVNDANDAPLRFSVSGEYRFPDYYDATVRAGYQSHDSIDNSLDSQIPALRGASIAGLTMGAGFAFRLPTFATLKLGLDYAMAPFGALGISHTITVKAKW